MPPYEHEEQDRQVAWDYDKRENEQVEDEYAEVLKF